MINDRTSSIVERVIVAVFSLFLIRAIITISIYFITSRDYQIFFSNSDIFADIIKTSFAEISISAPLFVSHAAHMWPPFLQDYLWKNPYLTTHLSIHHIPPLGTLFFMLFATLCLFMSPLSVLLILIILYATIIFIMCHNLYSLSSFTQSTKISLLILLSYPSIFMIDRGNFNSGITSLCVIFYILSVHFSRWKWAGCLALAIAVNFRPNVAVFALLELCRSIGRKEAAIGIAATGAMSLAIGLASLSIANRIDPAYSLNSFLKGYAIYQRLYVEGTDGIAWNASLANIAMVVRMQMRFSKVYSPFLGNSSIILGFSLTMLFAALSFWHKISKVIVVFALASICTLFTPVLGEYHVLIFVAPLLIIAMDRSRALTPTVLLRGTVCIITIQMACLNYWLFPSIIALVPLIALAMSFPFLISLCVGFNAETSKTNSIIGIVCIATISPLGDQISNGIVVALILSSTLAWLLWQTLSTPLQPKRNFTSAAAVYSMAENQNSKIVAEILASHSA